MNRAFIVAALTLGAALAATPAAAQSKGTPVRFDFRALAEDGSQIPDLRAEDLSLKVNGKPRSVTSLSFLRTVSDKAAPGSELPPPYATNAAGSSGRTIPAAQWSAPRGMGTVCRAPRGALPDQPRRWRFP